MKRRWLNLMENIMLEEVDAQGKFVTGEMKNTKIYFTDCARGYKCFDANDKIFRNLFVCVFGIVLVLVFQLFVINNNLLYGNV
jgi:hypothetical protein